jgi:hypothetical protein
MRSGFWLSCTIASYAAQKIADRVVNQWQGSFMLRGFFLVLLVVGSGAVFGRDLNKNGKMDPYEDSSRPVEERVENLLGQMTLDEKTCQLATLYGYGRVLKDKIFRPADPDKDFQEQGAEKKSFHGKGH